MGWSTPLETALCLDITLVANSSPITAFTCYSRESTLLIITYLLILPDLFPHQMFRKLRRRRKAFISSQHRVSTGTNNIITYLPSVQATQIFAGVRSDKERIGGGKIGQPRYGLVWFVLTRGPWWKQEYGMVTTVANNWQCIKGAVVDVLVSFWHIWIGQDWRRYR